MTRTGPRLGPSRAVATALAPRALATLFELAGVVLAVRVLGIRLYGTYQAAAVAGSLGTLALDLSRLTTGASAVAATRSLSVYRRLTRPRQHSALVLVAAAAVAYAVGLPWVGAGFAIAVATMVEQRWAMLAAGRTITLGVSFLARPIVSIITILAAEGLSASHSRTAQYALPIAAIGGGLLVAGLDRHVARTTLDPASADAGRSVPARARLPLTLASLLAAGYVSGDLLVVRGLAGPEQAGIYALAYKPVLALLVLVALLRDLWISDMASGAENARWGTLRQALVASGAVTLLLCALTLVLHPLRAATGTEHADVVTALLLLSIVPIVASSWYYARAVTLNRLSAPLPAVAVALVVDVVANLALVPSWGARGGAIATLFAEVVSTGAAAWVLLRPARR